MLAHQVGSPRYCYFAPKTSTPAPDLLRFGIRSILGGFGSLGRYRSRGALARDIVEAGLIGDGESWLAPVEWFMEAEPHSHPPLFARHATVPKAFALRVEGLRRQ